MEISNIFVEEILTTINKIKTRVSGITIDEFKANFHLVDDIIRYLNIIGEATQHISDEVKEKYQEIPWNTLQDLRDIINNPDHISLVWIIATEKLINLEENIKKIVNK